VTVPGERSFKQTLGVPGTGFLFNSSPGAQRNRNLLLESWFGGLFFLTVGAVRHSFDSQGGEMHRQTFEQAGEAA
jgi:hypothetical protein